jgi:hypothetical protein
MTEYWFKPKTHGYGAYPTHWKGWALTFGFVAVMVLLAGAIFGVPLLVYGTPPSLPAVTAFAVLEAALVLGFLLFVRGKTDGAWRWRWGGKP